MKQACHKFSDGNSVIQPFEKQATLADHLRAIAKAIIQARDKREDADCDDAVRWSREEFLVMLLGPRQRSRPA